VTGKMEKYFPAWKRRFRYVLSFMISLPFLGLGVGAMVLSLNLNGYIHDKESPFYFATLSKFAEPVGILVETWCHSEFEGENADIQFSFT